jgi:hypothetical protein
VTGGIRAAHPRRRRGCAGSPPPRQRCRCAPPRGRG